MLETRVDASAVQQRWEYHYDRFEMTDAIEVVLNEAGEERWELVSMFAHESQLCAVFKRPQRQFSDGREPRRDTEAFSPSRQPK